MSKLYQRLLGEAFAALPAAVRAMHSRELPQRFEGRASVVAGQNSLTRGLARLLGLPPACDDGAIWVAIEASDAGEIWTRGFPNRVMCSRLYADKGRLYEKLGPATLGFVLTADATGIDWRVVSFSVLGLTMPSGWLTTRIQAREFAHAGRYCFSIRASLPLFGHLIAYEGWLDVE